MFGLRASSAPLPLNFQNEEVRRLVGESGPQTTIAEKEAFLNKIIDALESRQTLTIRRFSSGGHAAVTPLDQRSLESAVDGMLIMHWDRDNIMQALAEYQLTYDDDQMRSRLHVARNAWLLGLVASLKHHNTYYKRFVEVIEGKTSAGDYSKRPHIRYNPISLQEVPDQWGHAQNDALGYVLFMTFYAANQGRLHIAEKFSPDKETGLPPKFQFGQVEAYKFGLLVPLFWEKIEVWKDIDFGAWEDKKAEHASSIMCALAALREEKKYVDNFGSLHANIDGKECTVTSNLLQSMIKKCEERLAQILPNEYIVSDKEDKLPNPPAVRESDSALINGLFLAAISGQPVVGEKMTEKVIGRIVEQLGRPIGFARYAQDLWDGRVDRHDLLIHEEAQWSHVSPMLSCIYGELYRRTKKKEYLEEQEMFFKRSLTTINKRWRIPEAYIVDPKSRKWVSDANEPLAWAQSVEIMAIISMKNSLALAAATSSPKKTAGRQ